MSCRSLMEKKVSTKLKVAFMTWFCLTLMLPEKMGSKSWKNCVKRITTPVLSKDCQREFGWQGTRFWAWSGWLPHQTFLPWRTQMRIQVLLKRSGKFNENTLTYGDIVVNLSTNEVKVEDTPVELLGKRVWIIGLLPSKSKCYSSKTQILTVYGDLIAIRRFPL